MINFEDRVGPDFGEHNPTCTEWNFPTWLADAKFGIFVHWGLYFIPAWAEVGDAPIVVKDAYRDHQYAEWYENPMRVEGRSAQTYQRPSVGEGTSHEDLADLWTAEKFDTDDCVALFRQAGARYVVPTAKHHDVFCLWATDTTPFNSPVRGPRRDLMQEFSDSSRSAKLKFGSHFSGALDWHVSDFSALDSDAEIFRLRRNDEEFARYFHAQAVDAAVDGMTVPAALRGEPIAVLSIPHRPAAVELT